MITTRRIERLFADQQPRRLYHELISGRPEANFALEEVLCRPVPLAALGMLRLDELDQSAGSLYRRVMGVVLVSQQSDGGWGDPMTTAICLRALLAGRGNGQAIERGLAWLARLQQPTGGWPAEALRRMPTDEFATAFILMQLGDRERFRRSVRFRQACSFLADNAKTMDPQARRLWDHAAIRCRVRKTDEISNAARPFAAAA